MLAAGPGAHLEVSVPKSVVDRFGLARWSFPDFYVHQKCELLNEGRLGHRHDLNRVTMRAQDNAFTNFKPSKRVL